MRSPAKIRAPDVSAAVINRSRGRRGWHRSGRRTCHYVRGFQVVRPPGAPKKEVCIDCVLVRADLDVRNDLLRGWSLVGDEP